MRKFYCYVDENGQDSEGRLFVVAVVILQEEKEHFFEFCETLESESRKGKFKWGKAQQYYRLEYLRRIFAEKMFHGCLNYCIFRGTKDYELATVQAIARAVVAQSAGESITAMVYVDGLSKIKRQQYAVQLRRLGVHSHKVQGVTKDENNALIRLADAIAGFVRDVADGEEGAVRTLFDATLSNGVLREV